MHVHVHHADGEAKFWLEPVVEAASRQGLRPRHMKFVEAFIREHEDEIRAAWKKHFRR